MEPWLDSLSEDWGSDNRSSSPAVSATGRRVSRSLSSSTQSRIPHLAHSLRRDSSVSYIKPRSTRGIARSKTNPVLTERTASSLNIPASHTATDKHGESQSVPRQPSSAFSESQQSVQHYSIRGELGEANETPEWKKRLAAGDNILKNGVDLFSPSKLEGIFKQSDDPIVPTAKEHSNQVKPWNSLSLQPLSLSEQYQSLRASRPRPGPLEVLAEENEDEELGQDLSAVSSELAHRGSLRGLVKHRVSEIEDKHPDMRVSGPSPKVDPRFRTISGREELKNEDISPVTMSKQNSITDRMIKGSQKVDTMALRDRLSQVQSTSTDRPSSSSSDRAVSYGHQALRPRPHDIDMAFADITSQSLPEDVSMGTQEFVSQGGYINGHRGEYSDESSFLRKGLSGLDSFHNTSNERNLFLRSSPPPYARTSFEGIENSRFTASLPASPCDDSIVHHSRDMPNPPSIGSPLKLFGNRDTFTNNRLLRALSHFEEVEDDLGAEKSSPQQDEALLKMSQFGQGELDEFDFRQEIERPQPESSKSPPPKDKIFTRPLPSETTDASHQEFNNLPETASDKVIIEQASAPETGSGLTERKHPGAPKPKRRRTLGDGQTAAEIHKSLPDLVGDSSNQLAGTKRKDARSGIDDGQADADTLASRTLLRPKTGRLTSSTNDPAMTVKVQPQAPTSASSLPQETTSLTKALAAELASFTQTQEEVHLDSRKPSYATKDYMEEANKVMQLIRAKGKPIPPPQVVEEPEFSDLNPDSILDVEVDGDSTKESFSRPPSRERPSKPRPNPRHMKHDSKTEIHLRQYKDSEDLDLLTSTSVLGALQVDDRAAEDAALVPIPDDEQESSPPNMRIRNHDHTQRKRKYSASTVEGQSSWNAAGIETQDSNQQLTAKSFPTSSSSGSGHKGVITSGTVSIPDHVGTMIFDHEKRIWVRQKELQTAEAPTFGPSTVVDDDPFGNIPDLSFDEQKEAEQAGSRANTLDQKLRKEAEEDKVERPLETRDPSTSRMALDAADSKNDAVESPEVDTLWTQKSSENDENRGSVSKDTSMRSQVSKHEIRLHEGLLSRPPAQNERKQPRVVTIAFSSPLVSAYHKEPSVSEIELEDEDDLPLDDSEMAISPVSTQKAGQNASEHLRASGSSNDEYTRNPGAMIFSRRPVSRIDERDEEMPDHGRSIVHVKHSGEMTPAPKPSNAVVSRTGVQPASILCLTPLSEFTFHQQDSAKHHEQSFVEERAHPHALRQAHGSLALAVDALIKAVTDAEPTEPFWENIRRLSLDNRNLTTTHGLKDYCSSLEDLCISDNSIAQLGGLPSSLRFLDVHANALTNMTSWGHLQNLQYVDVSNNQLDSLEGFSSLVHLRKIDARNNNISNIDGILDLDALLEVDLSHNKLVELDFESTDLPRMTRLALSNNQLISVRNLQFLPQLEELDVSNNDLQDVLAADTPALNSLCRVFASHNQLESFNFRPCPALEELVLDHNRVRSLSGLSSACNLRRLSLKRLIDGSDVVCNVLSTSNECEEIDVSWNKISCADLILPALPHYNLRKLEIAGCGLSSMPSGSGDSLPNCRTLNLSFNAIQDLQPLQGMLKLKELHLASNRIKRLRRTCLALSRLPALTVVDLSDNPLTVGFHAPTEADLDLQAAERLDTRLAARSQAQDMKWLTLLDEVTMLRRRTAELLLAQGCLCLATLDRLPFVREDVLKVDMIWQNLADRGVLQKSPQKRGVRDSEGIELPATAENAAHGEAMMDERSLMVNDMNVRS